MAYCVTVLPAKVHIAAEAGENLLSCLQRAKLVLDAPCGGQGQCGKCRVILDGQEVLACRTTIHRDMTVTLPSAPSPHILTEGIGFSNRGPVRPGWALALDIGTTTVVAFLLHDGAEVAHRACSNPQAAFGADVISRIAQACKGQRQALTAAIRDGITALTAALCQQAGIDPAQIEFISVVGNPAMQQLFLGLEVENLARLPFAPVLTEAKIVPAQPHLPCCENAQLLIVPDVSGFVGADTLACLLATGMDRDEKTILLVDIGTNGEMALLHRGRLLTCSAAAGPALEGAGISCGMRGQVGAIDHVWLEGGNLRCSVIGGAEAKGICGSGLIDAVAVALELALLNRRGRIQNGARCIRLTDGIALSQEDIRQLQLAKGAIRAGIQLLARKASIPVDQIQQVYLAGAFGSFMNPASACRIGLLPPQLEAKITAVGNAAGSGAKMLAASENAATLGQKVADKMEFMELATLPEFPRTFAKMMEFEE